MDRAGEGEGGALVGARAPLHSDDESYGRVGRVSTARYRNDSS